MKLVNTIPKRQVKRHSYYLAHPLNMRYEIREWELDFERRTGINLQNPFYDILGQEREDVKRIDSGDLKARTVRTKADGVKIVRNDLRLIFNQEGLVAICEKGQESMGTPMEVFFNAFVLKRPTYIVSQTLNGHPWLMGLGTKVFNTLPDFEAYAWKNLR